MMALSRQRIRITEFGFISAITAYAAVVSVLYWNQSMVTVLTNEFHGQAAITLVPMTPLLGFAIAVSLIAFVPFFVVYVSINTHLLILLISLFLATRATDAMHLSVMSFFVGWGAGVAPRLLAAAGHLAAPTDKGKAIGRAVCLGLTAILLVRLSGNELANLWK